MPAKADRECYVDRIGQTSVVFQAMCDASGIFTNVVGPWPGSVNDQRVMRNSTLFDRGWARTLLPNGMEGYVIADSGYMLTPWCMTPYDRRGGAVVTADQRRFNFRFNKTRVVIEHAFGRLKGRFRCLLDRLHTTRDYWTDMVMTCFTLHNFCHLQNEEFFYAWLLGGGAWREAFLHNQRAQAEQQAAADEEEVDMLAHDIGEARREFYVALNRQHGATAQHLRDGLRRLIM